MRPMTLRSTEVCKYERVSYIFQLYMQMCTSVICSDIITAVSQKEFGEAIHRWRVLQADS